MTRTFPNEQNAAGAALSSVGPSNRSDSLQALRAYAALAVLLEHALYRTGMMSPVIPGMTTVIPYGSLGVGIFFALSGWLMGTILMRGFDPFFLVRRAIRIYPPFWAACGISVLVFSAIGMATPWDWKAFFLVPAMVYTDNFTIPYWTLVYEMAFYIVVFGMMLLRLDKVRVEFVLVMWAALIVLYMFYFGEPQHVAPGRYILLSPINLYFILGMLCGVNKLEIPKAAPSSVVWIAALLLWTIGQSMGSQRILLFCVQSLAAVLTVLATLRIQRAPRAMTHLGDASYGLYLVHFIALEMIARLYPVGAGVHPFYVTFPIMFGGALAVGWVYGTLENALHKQVSRLFPKPQATRYAVSTDIRKAA